MRERMLSQDIAKGLMILVVVRFHSIQLTKELFYAVSPIGVCSMVFFFFMAGYNFRDKGLTPLQLIKQRVGKLFITYLLWTFGTFVVMGSYFLIRGDGTLEEIIKSFAASLLSESGCKMIGWKLPVSLFQHVLGPYWFIQYLITSTTVFCLVAGYALKSIKRFLSVTLLLLGISFGLIAFGIFLPWGLHCAPVIAASMLLGAKLGQNNNLFTATSKVGWIIVNSIISLAIVDLIQFKYPAAGMLGAGLLGEVIGPVEVFLAYASSLFGTYFVVNLGRLIEKIPVLSTGLIWLGQRTLIIFLLHRAVAYVIRDAMGLPHFISGTPLYIDEVTMPNLIAFLLVFVIIVPVIIVNDKIKASRTKAKAAT